MPGTYIFECWGAQGNIYTPTNLVGGKGAYTKGIISLRWTKTFYIFVGQFGLFASWGYAFNGGGFGQTTGGGASDIRLKDGKWDDFNSLKSRIMVAAGGGGPDYGEVGGAGGCLKGLDAHGKGGTQIEGGYGLVSGSFGKGGGYGRIDNDGCGGGGGGYYGGGSSTVYNNYAGGGGSSFISGYPGCNAISKDSYEGHITHTNSSVHYSGIKFESPVMIDGNSKMPSPTSTEDEIGNARNGYVRIAIINPNSKCTRWRSKRINKMLSSY